MSKEEHNRCEIATVFSANPRVVKVAFIQSNNLMTTISFDQRQAEEFIENFKNAVDAMRIGVATEPMFKKCATCGGYHDKLENGICERCITENRNFFLRATRGEDQK